MKEKMVYALGFFDGVHIGHQALLKACRELADAQGCLAGVATFSSHPETLLLGKTPAFINTMEDRRQLLIQYGMDTVVCRPFDEKLMATPWQAFLEELVANGAKGFVCGSDFRFGAGGEGTAEKLAEFCKKHRLVCAVVPQQIVEGKRVSSTQIRNLLEKGETEKAVRFLGHPHIVSAEVVPGRQLGRTIGTPTANLELPQGLVQPKFGVYACLVRAEGKIHQAVTNVGKQPTVGGDRLKIESWLLDFEGDLYGKMITVEFHAFLRREENFSDLSELKAQIQKDAEKTRDFFGKK